MEGHVTRFLYASSSISFYLSFTIILGLCIDMKIETHVFLLIWLNFILHKSSFYWEYLLPFLQNAV